jgi:DNA-binding transcriptional MerR regulator
MLRYYDQEAVLIPAYTDSNTGYRYYANDQIRDAVLVRSLRDLGFSVSAIAAVVPQAHDPQILRRALEAHRGELQSESSLVRRRLADLAHLIDNLTEVPITLADWRRHLTGPLPSMLMRKLSPSRSAGGAVEP